MSKRRTESLLNLSLQNLMYNLPKYSPKIELINELPYNIKNKILRKLTSSLRYTHDIDFNIFFEALVNPKITYLSLYVKVNSDILNMLKICKDMKKLTLNGIDPDNVVPSDLMQMFPHLKKLVYLEMKYCDKITDDVLKCISENCKELEGICFPECKNITDNGMVYLAELEHLIAVDLYETEISDEGVTLLVHGKNAKNFKELKLKSTKITDNSLKQICSNCPKIEMLVFYNNTEHEMFSPLESFEDYPLEHLKQFTFVVQW